VNLPCSDITCNYSAVFGLGRNCFLMFYRLYLLLHWILFIYLSFRN